MTHAQEIDNGSRFEFGANWARFLSVLDEKRIAEARNSLKEMLQCQSLQGKTFLDIGSGSGLFSLAARQLGARVHSFDYDPQSVGCTQELKRRFFEDDDQWRVESGSVLDAGYLQSLGSFDVVYSWGVLHHTGDMWQALENVNPNVARGGKLFIALYNDQGSISTCWLYIKKTYLRLPRLLRPLFAVLVYLPLEIRLFVRSLLAGNPGSYLASITHYQSNRGMSWWYDRIDWIGGLPFEVSRTSKVVSFYENLGYETSVLKPNGSLGCSEYVFVKK